MKLYLWTLSFLKPYRLQVALLVFIGLVITVGEMAVPKVIGLFIDHVLPEKDIGLFSVLLVGLAALLVVVILLKAGSNLLERIITEKAARDLQFTIFQKLRQLGFPYYEKHSVGESLSLMNTEVTAIQQLYREYFPSILKHSLIVIVIFSILLSMNLKLVLMMLPIFILYYFIGPIFEKRTIHATIQNAEDRVQLNKKYYDSLSALIELRAHNRTNWDLGRMHHKLDRFNRTWGLVEIYAWLRGVPRRLIVYGGAVILYWYGIHLVQAGELSVGEFVTFALYYGVLTFDVTFIMTLFIEMKIIMVQAKRLYALEKLIPEIEEVAPVIPINTLKGEFTFKNVTFSYPTSERVVANFSLTIKPGEKVALVGESGSGKTTVLKLVGRFYDPIEGEILLDDIPLKQLSLSQLRQSIGFVFQETYLFGTTIKENIRFGNPNATDEQIYEAAKAAYAHQFISKLPDGYETEVGERGYKLSGGQRQRIAIARMFIKDPAIMALDEATSALDNVSEQKVKVALDNLLKGRTTITVAHRLTSIKDYDRVIVMDRGKIIEEGKYEELLKRHGFLHELLKGGKQVG